MQTKKMTMGLIVGNRGFFPDHLAETGREEMLHALQAAGMEVVALTPQETKHGAVETREDSKRCAELLKRNRAYIDGIIVTLPNFGEERAIADTLRLADLRVPVLIQATPDDPQKMAELLSSACEVDICGVLGMHALQLASQTPSALLDWNNNYGSDPNKAICFHCSNLPKHFLRSVKMDFQQIIAGTVGKDNTFGTCVGLIKPEKMSFARFSTDDTAGKLRGYIGEGAFTDDPLNTFGGAGVVEIPQMQKLLRFICERGFEHHVAANLSTVAAAVHEATTRYLGWDMYWHRLGEC